ncbi:hypothetical protein NJ76_21770 [Rhodococcus sp. IITR03]|nr:hypothetical protein NJ76_21770 [Rhodococcus sp. IITR03]
MTRRTTARSPQIPDQIAGLVDPRLTEARCAGKSPLFDAELDNETAEERSARLTWHGRNAPAAPYKPPAGQQHTNKHIPSGYGPGMCTACPDARKQVPHETPHSPQQANREHQPRNAVPGGVRVLRNLHRDAAAEAIKLADELVDATEKLRQGRQ